MVKQVFPHINITKALTEIVNTHVEHFQSDLEIDLSLLSAAAKEGKSLQDRTFYWLCRPCGTWCLKEKNVFLKGTRDHSTWLYYAEQESTGILTYAIELDKQEKNSDILTGNLYELDYPVAHEIILRHAVPVSKTLLVYENKEIIMEPHSSYRVEVGNKELGKFIRFDTIPEDPAALDQILTKQWGSRKQAKDGNYEQYIRMLQKGAGEA